MLLTTVGTHVEIISQGYPVYAMNEPTCEEIIASLEKAWHTVCASSNESQLDVQHILLWADVAGTFDSTGISRAWAAGDWIKISGAYRVAV